VDDAKAWGLEICAMGGEGEGDDDDDDKCGRASQAGLLLCLTLCCSSKSIFGFLLCWGHSVFDERNHSALKQTHTHTQTLPIWLLIIFSVSAVTTAPILGGGIHIYKSPGCGSPLLHQHELYRTLFAQGMIALGLDLGLHTIYTHNSFCLLV
jgi:hypothetical protein